jgi:hypothetical protein
MKNLKPFKLYEGDWWDNDPSAPWNQPDGPEPTAYTEYPESKRDFVVLGIPGDNAVLRKKSDGSLWVLDVTDISDDYGDYLYQHVVDDDESERAKGYEEEEYASIATDMFKEGGYKEGRGAWEDRDSERLFKIDLGLAEVLIEDYVNYSKPRASRRWTPGTSDMAEYKRAASVLSKAFPEA